MSYLGIKPVEPSSFKDVPAVSVRDDIDLWVSDKHICTLVMAHRPGRVARWVKCLPYKHKGLSLHPQHPHDEPGKVAQTFTPALGKQRWEEPREAGQGGSVRDPDSQK